MRVCFLTLSLSLSFVLGRMEAAKWLTSEVLNGLVHRPRSPLLMTVALVAHAMVLANCLSQALWIHVTGVFIVSEIALVHLMASDLLYAALVELFATWYLAGEWTIAPGGLSKLFLLAIQIWVGLELTWRLGTPLRSRQIQHLASWPMEKNCCKKSVENQVIICITKKKKKFSQTNDPEEKGNLRWAIELNVSLLVDGISMAHDTSCISSLLNCQWEKY